MDKRDFTIGVLSTTAVILFVGLAVIHTRPQLAYASGMGDRGGDYLVLSGAVWDQEEYLYVFNTAQNKMMIYRYDRNKKSIIAHGPADLNRLFQGGTPARTQRGNRRP